MSADSAPCSPARWLYPMKPGGERKSADIRQKTVTLIYLDPFWTQGWSQPERSLLQDITVKETLFTSPTNIRLVKK